MQPNIGVIGAQVRDRARQKPSHWLWRVQDLPPSRVSRTQALAPLSPAVVAREHHLSALICEELRRARIMHLGVLLPQDKRLKNLCEAVLQDPTRHERLEDWVLDTGASLRTVARLFRSELGCTFTQWRQQVVLAQAVALAARQPEAVQPRYDATTSAHSASAPGPTSSS